MKCWPDGKNNLLGVEIRVGLACERCALSPTRRRPKRSALVVPRPPAAATPALLRAGSSYPQIIAISSMSSSNQVAVSKKALIRFYLMRSAQEINNLSELQLLTNPPPTKNEKRVMESKPRRPTLSTSRVSSFVLILFRKQIKP